MTLSRNIYKEPKKKDTHFIRRSISINTVCTCHIQSLLAFPSRGGAHFSVHARTDLILCTTHASMSVVLLNNHARHCLRLPTMFLHVCPTQSTSLRPSTLLQVPISTWQAPWKKEAQHHVPRGRFPTCS